MLRQSLAKADSADWRRPAAQQADQGSSESDQMRRREFQDARESLSTHISRMSEGAVGINKIYDDLKRWDKVDSTHAQANESTSPVDSYTFSDDQDPTECRQDSFQLPKTFDSDASLATLGIVTNSLLNMPLERKRACAQLKREKRHLQLLLGDSEDKEWAQTCCEEVEHILDDGIISKVVSCSCDGCKEGRTQYESLLSDNEVSFWVGKMKGSKRLFATCILSDQPYLIYSFLQHNFDDAQFDGCISATDLRDQVHLPLENAKSLLDAKENFFDGGMISLFTYMRSTKPRGDLPLTEEKNWVIDGFLNISEKLALEPNAHARKIPTGATIKDLMIRDSPARPLDRIADSVTGLGEQAICMQSLGHLLLDLICFIAGGGSYVQTLDKSRASGKDWIGETDWKILDKIDNLTKAFQLAQIMICPNEQLGLSKDDHGNDNFKNVSQQLHRIWPHRTSDDSLNHPEQERNSDATSLSSQGLGVPAKSSSYEEIEADAFRSMPVRYQKEGQQQRRCRMTVFKTKDDGSIKLDLLSFDYDAINPKSYCASPNDLRFVPLYAYDHHDVPNEFSAKFQLRPGSEANLTIPQLFKFQTIEDVKLFQAAVTGRIIEKDVSMDQLSLELKKKRRFAPSIPESFQAKPARLQLWRVLDERGLREAHRSAQMAVHGAKPYPLRAEIALFFEHTVLVIGSIQPHREHPAKAMLTISQVKSYLRLKDLNNFELRIETREPARAASLEGKRLRTNDSTYPGLPLFQSSSFVSYQEGEKVVCESMKLKFSTKQARDDLSQYLEARYNRPQSPVIS